MAGGASEDQDEMITQINVVPLVDIILVLLIIFMLTANIINNPAIEVDLPEAATGESPQEPTTVALTLTEGGEVFINGKSIAPDALAERLAATVEDDPEAQAIIAADQSVSHGEVIWLIDLVRQQGIFKFALNVDPSVASDIQRAKTTQQSPAAAQP